MGELNTYMSVFDGMYYGMALSIHSSVNNCFDPCFLCFCLLFMCINLEIKKFVMAADKRKFSYFSNFEM